MQESVTFFTSSKKKIISITNVSSERKVKLFGINLKSRLNFDYHVNTLLNKVSKNYDALARVCNYMNTHKQTYESLYNMSVFLLSTCMDMFHSRNINNKINTRKSLKTGLY